MQRRVKIVVHVHTKKKVISPANKHKNKRNNQKSTVTKPKPYCVVHVPSKEGSFVWPKDTNVVVDKSCKKKHKCKSKTQLLVLALGHKKSFVKTPKGSKEHNRHKKVPCACFKHSNIHSNSMEGVPQSWHSRAPSAIKNVR